jgi:hypothetical protein
LELERAVLTRGLGWFVRLGLKVAIADINVEALAALAKELGAVHGETNVISVPTDVSKLEDVVRLRERVYEAWGEVSVVRRGLPSPPPPLPLSFPPSPPLFVIQTKRKGFSPTLLSPAVAHPLCPHPLFLVFRLPYCSIMPELRYKATLSMA